MQKRWQVAPSCPADFQRALGVESPTLAQLLWNRGLRTSDEATAFLNPSWETGAHAPGQFRQMAAAVARTFQAIENHEHITIHGDYDADGVTGSAVVIIALREIEKRITHHASHTIPTDDRCCVMRDTSCVDSYIPHRDKEGYGLHRETVTILAERGTQLLITVDCGIACADEIALAKTSGMDTIVVDHHQFGDTLPQAHLIHPGLPDEPYPFKQLAAVGVAFKFASALLDEGRRRGLAIPLGWEKWLLDLVAIATVTDMVPLIGENRILEKFGLTVLNKTRRPGLLALIRLAGLENKPLDTESIGFALGPRINAAGRMDHAGLALRLVLAETDAEADALAAELEQRNRERQDVTRRMLGEADGLIADQNLLDARILVLWHEAWSPSLVGLVAGKYLERVTRPTIAIGRHENTWIGSGRSQANFDITAALRECGDGLLTRLGGHRQACGFTLTSHEHLPTLRERLTKHAADHLTENDLVPVLDIDAEIPLTEADWPLANDLEQLRPYGQGNPQPIFMSRASVLSTTIMGSQRNHLRLTLLKPDGNWIKAVGFKMADLATEMVPGTQVEVAYHLTVNEWNGKRNVEMRIIDLKKFS